MSCSFDIINYSDKEKRFYDVLSKLFLHKLPFTISDKRLEIDYLRFIYLKVVTQDVDGTIISPTIEIDEIWHTHLLHNKNYLDMCIKINFIVYHYPEREDDTQEVKNKRIDIFKQLYYKHFQILQYHDKYQEKEYSTPITLFIKTVTGKNITIEISLDCNVAELKNLIYLKEKIQIQRQKLIFAGKRIDQDNTKTLREFNIENHSTIHMMFELKGC
jgi:hypothetical protein